MIECGLRRGCKIFEYKSYGLTNYVDHILSDRDEPEQIVFAYFMEVEISRDTTANICSTILVHPFLNLILEIAVSGTKEYKGYASSTISSILYFSSEGTTFVVSPSDVPKSLTNGFPSM
jgi:hypothetical protein